MKKKFKKAVTVILTAAMAMTVGVPAFAGEIEITEGQVLTPSLISNLTVSDYANCYEEFLEYKDSNPNITLEELNEYASMLILEAAENKTHIQPAGYDEDLLVEYGIANSLEAALITSHPAEALAIYDASETALDAVDARYNQGKALGNGDAFRHATWNAIAVARMYDLHEDIDQAVIRTRVWTDAHENGAEQATYLSDTQFAVDKEMDFHNNSIGRAVGEANYNQSDNVIFNRVQYYVDNGVCVKIKEDENITLEPEVYAKLVTNWTLKETNTVGKITN